VAANKNFFMEHDKKYNVRNANDCTPPEDKSISEKVHKHLKDKNDHITDEDIRRAKINPEENELDRKPETFSKDNARETGLNTEQKEEKKEGTKLTTPWDIVDKNALE
jgi:hypothetical protein